MPAYPIPVAGLIEATIHYQIAGQTCLNIGHWRWDGDSSAPDGPATLDAFVSSWDAGGAGITTKLAALCTTDVTIVEIVAQLIYPSRWARKVYAPAVSAGTQDPPSCPPNWCATSTKRSFAAGPGGHGSLFTSGFPAEAIAADRITNTVVTEIDTYANKFHNIIILLDPEGEFTPVIYNRKFPATSKDIISVSTSPEPRSLRRRQLRQGV